MLGWEQAVAGGSCQSVVCAELRQAAAAGAGAAEAVLEGHQQPVRRASGAGLGRGRGRRLLPVCGVC